MFWLTTVTFDAVMLATPDDNLTVGVEPMTNPSPFKLVIFTCPVFAPLLGEIEYNVISVIRKPPFKVALDDPTPPVLTTTSQ